MRLHNARIGRQRKSYISDEDYKYTKKQVKQSGLCNPPPTQPPPK